MCLPDCSKIHVINYVAPVIFLSRQELAASPDVAPYICGAVVADGPVFPGETWRGTLEVDEHVCPNAKYSVVTMLSECLPVPVPEEQLSAFVLNDGGEGDGDVVVDGLPAVYALTRHM